MHNKSRLKIWVCEYVSAGGLASEPLPASLLQEGLLMRDALLADLSALGVDCITSHDSRVAAPQHAASHAVHPDEDPYTLWRQQLSTHDIDACWVIAPETGGILYDMHTLVQAANKPWIGCTAKGIHQTSVKSLMTDMCQQAGVPVLPYVFLDQVEPLESLPWYGDAVLNGWVIKPDDGAGCESTYYFNNMLELIEFKNKNKLNELVSSSRCLLQPYLPGRALSMSVLSTLDQVKVIAGHEQLITVEESMFRFQGAGVNQAADYLPAMQDLAEQVHHAIPGLLGYWGADMILTADNQLILVEVNPRLTTPYMALSQLLSDNPAEMILDAVLNQLLNPAIAKSSTTLTLATAAIAREESLLV
ncbi:MAG: ATP-grasp domain-containing protein [Methylophilus methylotrophus]|uniref:ATP-grasp domain-containing protein n=1 Tax=Methylophilus methylotrophus TaxID=17 RepID=A0A5C7WNR6_METME|nr:MAG: ATP-grasp domain-containing protein [Methylophilus methylotrophus]